MKHGKMDYRSFVDLKDRRCQRATDLSLSSLPSLPRRLNINFKLTPKNENNIK